MEASRQCGPTLFVPLHEKQSTYDSIATPAAGRAMHRTTRSVK